MAPLVMTGATAGIEQQSQRVWQPHQRHRHMCGSRDSVGGDDRGRWREENGVTPTVAGHQEPDAAWTVRKRIRRMPGSAPTSLLRDLRCMSRSTHSVTGRSRRPISRPVGGVSPSPGSGMTPHLTAWRARSTPMSWQPFSAASRINKRRARRKCAPQGSRRPRCE